MLVEALDVRLFVARDIDHGVTRRGIVAEVLEENFGVVFQLIFQNACPVVVEGDACDIAPLAAGRSVGGGAVLVNVVDDVVYDALWR